MTKRELELDNARLRGQVEVLERELRIAREQPITIYPTVAPVIVPSAPPPSPYQPWEPWYVTPTVTCGGN
jgi:hypothetical protein